MIWTVMVIILGVVIVLLALVTVVARAISPIGRNGFSLVESYDGPPEAQEAHAQLQRLEFQYELAESMGSLDAGSLEDLRQQVVAARTHYEEAVAFLSQTDTQTQPASSPVAAEPQKKKFPGLSGVPVLGFTENVLPTSELKPSPKKRD